MHQYDLVKAAIDAIVKDAVSPSTKAKIKRRAQRLVNKWRTADAWSIAVVETKF